MRAMSLRTKSLKILGAVVLLATIFNFGVLYYLVYPSFIELEQVEAERNLKRTQDAIQNELSHMSTFAWDWAAWDDSYEYIENPNQEYVDSNLGAPSFFGNSINLIMYYNSKGKLIWGKIYDLILEEEIAIEKIPSITLSPTHSLLSHSTVKSAPAGVMLTNRGPMLIASRPIVSSKEEGPIRGTLVMGKFLNGPVIEMLQKQTQVEFQIWPLDERPSSPIEQEALVQLETGKQIVLRERGDEVLVAYSLLLDYENRPAVLLRADTPRSISAVGIQTLKVALLGLLAAGVIVLVITWTMLRKIVISLSRLTEATRRFGRGDLSARIDLDSRDEMGELARVFNEMGDNLAAAIAARDKAEGELLRNERLAALGQITATVSHELRNPLGSIRTALAVVRKLARGEDPMMKESLDISDRGITRCDAIINDLLDFTRIRQLNREPTAIDRWLRTVLEEHGLAAPVRPRLELEAGIEMPLDRDRLRRVVVNVIDNACDAMDGKEPAGDRAPLLTVGTRVNGGRLEITVRDTGHGMAPEVAAKAFEPLFSTKAFGVGLGLPLVRQIMEQHGGGVDITSQEEGGTEVVLWLPLAAEARGDAA